MCFRADPVARAWGGRGDGARADLPRLALRVQRQLARAAHPARPRGEKHAPPAHSCETVIPSKKHFDIWQEVLVAVWTSTLYFFGASDVETPESFFYESKTGI